MDISRSECFVCKKAKGLIPYKDLFFCESCAFEFLYKADVAFNFILVENRRNDFYHITQVREGTLYQAIKDRKLFDSVMMPYIRTRIRDYVRFCEQDPFILTLEEAKKLIGGNEKWQVL